MNEIEEEPYPLTAMAAVYGKDGLPSETVLSDEEIATEVRDELATRLPIMEIGGSVHIVETSPDAPPKIWPHKFATLDEANLFLDLMANGSPADTPVPLGAVFTAYAELVRIRDFLATISDFPDPLFVASELCAARPWDEPTTTKMEAT